MSLAADGVRFGVLGPLLVSANGTVVTVPAPRQRTLLAALLMRAGQLVPADALAEAVWDGLPPPGAVGTLRSYVMRLRRVLGPMAAARVVTRLPGYLVEADEGEVDLLRFAALCREAGVALRAGEWQRAAGVLAEGLGLWRGAPLADVPSQVLLRDGVPRLEQMRLQALEWQMEAGLHLGRHAELAAELSSLAAAHPLRERFQVQLMMALYRSGRQADALAAYRVARDTLAGELGIEPGPELQELHRRILAADSQLAVPPLSSYGLAATASPPAAAWAVVPRQLPAAVRHFTGRRAELEQLTAMLGQVAGPAGTVVISAIGGMAGVGKTTLAVHWAHQVAERFPDGQLFVNLRGYGPTGTPVMPATAIAGFLEALHVPAEQIPADPDALAGLYRSVLAGRRMLIVLDNARDEQQVRPLLPASTGCQVLVTSRRQLAGMVTAEGAHPIILDVLTEEGARDLLAARLGERVTTDPRAAAELVRLCGRLPLALAITAARAMTRPGHPLAALATELREAENRLDALDADDPAASARAVFGWSCQQLSPETARVFRLLGLHPGPAITVPAAASLARLPLGQARRSLGELVSVYLLTEQSPGRYALHDLLRVYAADLAAHHDSEDSRQAALTSLFDYYLAAAAAAMDALFPAEKPLRPRITPPPGIPVPAMTDPAKAGAWLDAELPTLVAISTHTARHGWPSHAIRLSVTLGRYLLGGHYTDGAEIHSHALHAARESRDRAAQARIMYRLGSCLGAQGRHLQATDHLQQALALAREVGDRFAESRALDNLGGIRQRQGRYQLAAGCHRQALSLCRENADRNGETHALGNLGVTYRRLGRYLQSASYFRQALALAREIGHRNNEAHALTSLGAVYFLQGRHQQAADHHQQALALFKETGDSYGKAHALAGLGAISQRQGDYQQAAGYHEQALSLYREIGDRSGEATVLNNAGETLLAAGQPTQAYAQYAAALALAHATGDRHQQAHALAGLGAVSQRQGDYQQAAGYHEQALSLYREIGDRSGEATVLNNAGETLLAAGQPTQAHAQHAAALTLAARAGNRYEEARAHHGLARTCHVTGHLGEARHDAQRALALYAALSVPEAQQVKAMLQDDHG